MDRRRAWLVQDSPKSHAGAKAWLAAELAKELGAWRRNGQSLGDGIVANVEISFTGTIMSLLQPRQDAAKPDPWAFDRLTFAVLDLIPARDVIMTRTVSPRR